MTSWRRWWDRLWGGCWHANYTFPQTIRDEYGRKHTYVACLECGRRFEYDWGRMRVQFNKEVEGCYISESQSESW